MVWEEEGEVECGREEQGKWMGEGGGLTCVDLGLGIKRG